MIKITRGTIMTNTQKIENNLRNEIDVMLDNFTPDQFQKLAKLCDGSDAELNDAHFNYNDDNAAYRPNIDVLEKYKAAILKIRAEGGDT